MNWCLPTGSSSKLPHCLDEINRGLTGLVRSHPHRWGTQGHRYNGLMAFSYKQSVVLSAFVLALVQSSAAHAQAPVAPAEVAAPAPAEAIGTANSTPQPHPAPPPAPAPVAIPATVNSTDLWMRIRRGFVMQDMVSPLVQNQELWYANRPDYINRFVERGSRYMFHVIEELEKRGLPTEIALLPIIESAFNPQAYSRAHAAGMWQFIPSTGKIYGLSQDWMTDNRRDVLLSTNAALDYLQKLYGMFNSWELAFAAYNCGEGCVGRAIAFNQRKGLPTDFANLRLPNETRSYVPKLIAVKNIILSPGSYGIDLPPLINRPFFAQVAAPEKIDVHLAARLAEMELEAFQQLNPAFNKPVAATGTGYFLVPIEHADVFRENLALYQSLNGPMVSWTVVSAKRGESVDTVAKKHGMTASYLRATNGPFKERKGKFTQPVTFMAPNAKDAHAIRTAFDQKVALKTQQREQRAKSVIEGDDRPLSLATNSAPTPAARENLVLASTKPVASSDAVNVASISPPTTPSPTPVLPSVTAQTGAAIEPVPPPVTADSYTVQRGDTLFSIAKRTNLPLNDLKTLNGLTSNSIAVGKTLQLPAGTVLAPAPAMNESAAAAFISAAKSTGKTYVVRAGDTLFSIAKKFSTSVSALQQVNNLTAKALIRPGQKLRI